MQRSKISFLCILIVFFNKTWIRKLLSMLTSTINVSIVLGLTSRGWYRWERAVLCASRTPRDVASSTSGQPPSRDDWNRRETRSRRRQSTSVGARHPCVAYRASLAPKSRSNRSTNPPHEPSLPAKSRRSPRFWETFPRAIVATNKNDRSTVRFASLDSRSASNWVHRKYFLE